MRWFSRRLLILALLLLMAAPVLAAPYDMVVVGDIVGGCYILSSSYPAIDWIPFWWEHPWGNPTNLFTVAAAPGERVYATVVGPRIEIVELKADHSRTPFFSGADGYTAASLAADSSGNIHVLARQGTNGAILSISSNGALVAIHSLGFTIDYSYYAFDLASDQCTVAIGAQGVIHRFDVCTGTALPDLASTSAQDLVFLPNGDVLVATDTGLRRYDSLGVLLRTIDLGDSPNTITLHDQGNKALVETGCDSGNLVEVDLITGATSYLAGSLTITQPRAILVPDGWTAAFGPAALARVPTLSTSIAIVFAALLALVALHRMS